MYPVYSLCTDVRPSQDHRILRMQTVRINLASFTLYPREIKLVYTDIAIKVPLGHYGRIAPKSGLTLKHHVTVLAGVVDPDYTGNVGVVLHNLSTDMKFTRLVGQPIGQLILEVASIFLTLEVGEQPITAWGPYDFGSHD